MQHLRSVFWFQTDGMWLIVYARQKIIIFESKLMRCFKSYSCKE